MQGNQFVYTRERRLFGRQCLFTDRNQLMLSINPSQLQRLQYILRNPVDASTQLSDQMAFSVMETENVTLADRGMYHYEGGWPKEVNIHDEESTIRHRKKIERDDNWGLQVRGLVLQSLEKGEENTSVNIYQEFFVEMPRESGEDIKARFEARQKNIFHDPLPKQRPISVVDWAPTGVDRFLVLHTDIPFQRKIPKDELKTQSANEGADKRKSLVITPETKRTQYLRSIEANNFYIWNMENPLKPMVVFYSDEKVLTTFFCPKDETFIAGGLYSGKVCLWESRTGTIPLNMCPLEAAHREAVSALCWVHSKTNTEFYSGSYDGSVKYWDGRDLENPLQEILLDTELTDNQSRKRAHGVTVLEFEYTIPIRYIIGSDLGSIFIGNRKGMTPMDTLAAGNYRLFRGPIRTIERNPTFVKNFLISADWCAKIWAEECKGSPTTLLMKKKNQIICGSWSTTRCSLFVTGDSQGELDFYDLLLHQRKPIFSMKFSSRILYVKFRPDGEFLTVCLGNGDIQILELDEALKHSTSKDKALIGAIFEREMLRCKHLEGRTEEIKLRNLLAEAERERLKAMPKEEKILEDLDPDNPDDFLRIVASDVEFREVLDIFHNLVLKVQRKRQNRQHVMERTDFEPERIVEEIVPVKKVVEEKPEPVPEPEEEDV